MIDFDAILEKHKEVQRRENTVRLLRARATDTTVKMTGMPTGGGDGKRMERDVTMLLDASTALGKATEELEAMKAELDRYIPRLEKWQQQEAIRKRYMDGMSIEAVSIAIGYECRQTARFIDSAKKIINGTKMS